MQLQENITISDIQPNKIISKPSYYYIDSFEYSIFLISLHVLF